MGQDGMDTVADALQRLADRMDRMESGRGRGRARREPDEDDAPESAAPARRGKSGKPQGVAFEIKVPVGRDGKILKGLLFLDVAVRDDRDLEELADDVDRQFRSANVCAPERERSDRGDSVPTCYSCGKRGHMANECRSSRGGGGGGGYYRGNGGGYDRDRDFRR